jgi:hypothetical protein
LEKGLYCVAQYVIIQTRPKFHGEILASVKQTKKERGFIMKKLLVLAALAAVAFVMTGCGSLRTPVGQNNKKIYYNTFFGLSLDSAVEGDGFKVQVR